MKPLNTSPSDAVTDLLTALAVHSSVYCLSELRAPWGFHVDGADVAKFHLVLEGTCWLAADGLSPLRLTAGDLVILSRGERHTMCDEPGSPVLGLDLLIADHPLDDRQGGDIEIWSLMRPAIDQLVHMVGQRGRGCRPPHCRGRPPRMAWKLARSGAALRQGRALGESERRRERDDSRQSWQDSKSG